MSSYRTATRQTEDFSSTPLAPGAAGRVSRGPLTSTSSSARQSVVNDLTRRDRLRPPATSSRSTTIPATQTVRARPAATNGLGARSYYPHASFKAPTRSSSSPRNADRVSRAIAPAAAPSSLSPRPSLTGVVPSAPARPLPLSHAIHASERPGVEPVDRVRADVRASREPATPAVRARPAATYGVGGQSYVHRTAPYCAPGVSDPLDLVARAPTDADASRARSPRVAPIAHSRLQARSPIPRATTISAPPSVRQRPAAMSRLGGDWSVPHAVTDHHSGSFGRSDPTVRASTDVHAQHAHSPHASSPRFRSPTRSSSRTRLATACTPASSSTPSVLSIAAMAFTHPSSETHSYRALATAPMRPSASLEERDGSLAMTSSSPARESVAFRPVSALASATALSHRPRAVTRTPNADAPRSPSSRANLPFATPIAHQQLPVAKPSCIADAVSSNPVASRPLLRASAPPGQPRSTAHPALEPARLVAVRTRSAATSDLGGVPSHPRTAPERVARSYEFSESPTLVGYSVSTSVPQVRQAVLARSPLENEPSPDPSVVAATFAHPSLAMCSHRTPAVVSARASPPLVVHRSSSAMTASSHVRRFASQHPGLTPVCSSLAIDSYSPHASSPSRSRSPHAARIPATPLVRARQEARLSTTSPSASRSITESATSVVKGDAATIRSASTRAIDLSARSFTNACASPPPRFSPRRDPATTCSNAARECPSAEPPAPSAMQSRASPPSVTLRSIAIGDVRPFALFEPSKASTSSPVHVVHSVPKGSTRGAAMSKVEPTAARISQSRIVPLVPSGFDPLSSQTLRPGRRSRDDSDVLDDARDLSKTVVAPGAPVLASIVVRNSTTSASDADRKLETDAFRAVSDAMKRWLRAPASARCAPGARVTLDDMERIMAELLQTQTVASTCSDETKREQLETLRRLADTVYLDTTQTAVQPAVHTGPPSVYKQLAPIPYRAPKGSNAGLGLISQRLGLPEVTGTLGSVPSEVDYGRASAATPWGLLVPNVAETASNVPRSSLPATPHALETPTLVSPLSTRAVPHPVRTSSVAETAIAMHSGPHSSTVSIHGQARTRSSFIAPSTSPSPHATGSDASATVPAMPTVLGDIPPVCPTSALRHQSTLQTCSIRAASYVRPLSLCEPLKTSTSSSVHAVHCGPNDGEAAMSTTEATAAHTSQPCNVPLAPFIFDWLSSQTLRPGRRFRHDSAVLNIGRTLSVINVARGAHVRPSVVLFNSTSSTSDVDEQLHAGAIFAVNAAARHLLLATANACCAPAARAALDRIEETTDAFVRTRGASTIELFARAETIRERLQELLRLAELVVALQEPHGTASRALENTTPVRLSSAATATLPDRSPASHSSTVPAHVQVQLPGTASKIAESSFVVTRSSNANESLMSRPGARRITTAIVSPFCLGQRELPRAKSTVTPATPTMWSPGNASAPCSSVHSLTTNATARSVATQGDVGSCSVSAPRRALLLGDISAGLELDTRAPGSRNWAHRTDSRVCSIRASTYIASCPSSVHPGLYRTTSPGDASAYTGEVQPVLHANLLDHSRQASVPPRNHSRSDSLPSSLGNQDTAALKPLLHAPANIRCARGARVTSERMEEVTFDSWMTSCLLACAGDAAMYSHSGLPVDAHIAATNDRRLSPARATARNAPAAIPATPTVPGDVPHVRSTPTRVADRLAPSFAREDGADGATQSRLLSPGDASRSSQSCTIVEHKTFATAHARSTVLDKSPRLSSVSTASAPAFKFPSSFSAPARWMSPGETPERSSFRLSSVSYTNRDKDTARLESGSYMRTMLAADVPSLQTYTDGVIPFILSPGDECTDIVRENALVGNETTVQQNTKAAWFETDVAPGAPVTEQHVECDAFRAVKHVMKHRLKASTDAHYAPGARVATDCIEEIITSMSADATVKSLETGHLCRLAEPIITLQEPDASAGLSAGSAILLCPPSLAASSDASTFAPVSLQVAPKPPVPAPVVVATPPAHLSSVTLEHSLKASCASSPRSTESNASTAVPSRPIVLDINPARSTTKRASYQPLCVFASAVIPPSSTRLAAAVLLTLSAYSRSAEPLRDLDLTSEAVSSIVDPSLVTRCQPGLSPTTLASISAPPTPRLDERRNTAATQSDTGSCPVSVPRRALSPGDASAGTELDFRTADSCGSARRTDPCDTDGRHEALAYCTGRKVTKPSLRTPADVRSAPGARGALGQMVEAMVPISGNTPATFVLPPVVPVAPELLHVSPPCATERNAPTAVFAMLIVPATVITCAELPARPLDLIAPSWTSPFGRLDRSVMLKLEREPLLPVRSSSTSRGIPLPASLDQSELNTSMSPALRSLFNEAIHVNSTTSEDKNKDTNEIELTRSKTKGVLLRFAQTLEWEDYGTVREAADVVQMVPLSSERKAMGIVVRLSDNRYRFYVKGAEIFTELCPAHTMVTRFDEPLAPEYYQSPEVRVPALDQRPQLVVVVVSLSLKAALRPSVTVQSEQDVTKFNGLMHELVSVLSPGDAADSPIVQDCRAVPKDCAITTSATVSGLGTVIPSTSAAHLTTPTTPPTDGTHPSASSPKEGCTCRYDGALRLCHALADHVGQLRTRPLVGVMAQNRMLTPGVAFLRSSRTDEQPRAQGVEVSSPKVDEGRAVSRRPIRVPFLFRLLQPVDLLDSVQRERQRERHIASAGFDNALLRSSGRDVPSQTLSCGDRSTDLRDVQAVVCASFSSAYDLGGESVVPQLSYRTYLPLGDAYPRKFVSTDSPWRSLLLGDTIYAALHGGANCVSHAECDRPYSTPTDKENVNMVVDPCFRTDPKRRWPLSSILKLVPSSESAATPPSSSGLAALAAIPKTHAFYGLVGEWHVASLEASLLSPGDAGTSTTMHHAVDLPLLHAFPTRDLQAGDADKTSLHVKLNGFAKLVEKLGSAASCSAFLFAFLTIDFFTRLGRNTGRIRSEEASNFVDILITAITLIVVIPEGLPLMVTLALEFASKCMTGQNMLVRVLSPRGIIANASVTCTNKTGTLTQNLMTVVGLVACSVCASIYGEFVPYLKNNMTSRNVGDTGDEHAKQDAHQNITKDGRLAECGHRNGLARDTMQWSAMYNANRSFETPEWAGYRGACKVANMTVNERKAIGVVRKAPNAPLSFSSVRPACRRRPVATKWLGASYTIVSMPPPRSSPPNALPTAQILVDPDELARLVAPSARPRPARRSAWDASGPLLARVQLVRLARPVTQSQKSYVASPSAYTHASHIFRGHLFALPSRRPFTHVTPPRPLAHPPIARSAARLVPQPVDHPRSTARPSHEYASPLTTFGTRSHWSVASALPARTARSSGRPSPGDLVARVLTRTRRALISPSLHVRAAPSNITRVPTVQRTLQRVSGNVAEATLHPARIPSVSKIRSHTIAFVRYSRCRPVLSCAESEYERQRSPGVRRTQPVCSSRTCAPGAPCDLMWLPEHWLNTSVQAVHAHTAPIQLRTRHASRNLSPRKRSHSGHSGTFRFLRLGARRSNPRT